MAMLIDTGTGTTAEIHPDIESRRLKKPSQDGLALQNRFP